MGEPIFPRGQFELVKKLGAGAFGEIYQGLFLSSAGNQDVAIKLESVNSKHPQLNYEAKLYLYLHKDTTTIEKGIPRIHSFGLVGNQNTLVMDLMGPSLEDLFTACGRRFTLKTVIMIAEQMLTRIEYIHSRYILHRDIKPDNFVIGTGKKQNTVYLIDFGLAKRYIGRDGKHILYREGKSLTGTARYASVSTHLGIEQARRDDLESLGYIMVYFLKGILPWQNMKADNKTEKYQKIMAQKLKTTVEVLCKDLPSEIATFITYTKQLKFEDKPDYNFLRGLLKNLFMKQGYQLDYQYDWYLLNKQNSGIKKEILDKGVIVENKIPDKIAPDLFNVPTNFNKIPEIIDVENFNPLMFRK